MKAALIPPKGYESTALQSNIHLVLPLKPLLGNIDYIATYKRAHSRGDYIILDNGCAEGQLVDGRTLLDFAALIGAHEVVAPDIMSNAALTLQATANFLNEFPQASDYNIMAVLQGNTKEELEGLLRQFANYDEISTIGVPKVLVRPSSYRSPTRLDVVNMIHDSFPGRFKIHLLGVHKAHPTELFDTPFDRGSIRSVDSAQPYKLAEVGMLMSTKNSWAERRNGYFTKKKEVDPAVLRHNIETFKAWAASHES